MDLRDSRGRLIRLALAAAIGVVVAALVLRAIGPAENPDPVASGSVAMLGIAIFVVITAVAHGAVTKIHRRLRK